MEPQRVPIKRLERFRIINEKLNDLHLRAGQLLGVVKAGTNADNAKKALNERRYQDFAALARAAHGFREPGLSRRAETADDVVKGVVFYLALLIPFAFFAERLVFARPNINDQVREFCLIFIGIFLIFSWVHPAFKITMNPVIILLAFVMLALSILVIWIIVGKFEEQLKELQRQMGGTHSADIGRMGVAQAAFNLGISNMRRRPVRHRLDQHHAGLADLHGAVVHLGGQPAEVQHGQGAGQAAVSGHRGPVGDLKPLEEQAYRLIGDEFGANNAVAGRVWFYTSELGEQSFVNVTCNKSNADYDAKALCGLTPDEARVTRVDECLEPGGRWFNETDRYACILPEGIADAFNLDAKDYGSTKVRINGLEFDLIGILNNAKLKKLEDLDSEMLTPVDFIMMQQMQGQQGGGGGGGAAGMRSRASRSTCT
ncbi:MAG: hypothetical protein M5U09_29465 [Gammaproteobacteria bacterium]|nr:hypothetical protein [Gammaproteobacteria bacterium]